MSGEEKQPAISSPDGREGASVRGHATAMGKLAASLGHEFNNPLGYVCSSVDYCKNYLTQLHDKTHAHQELDASALKEDFAQLIEAMNDAQEGLARMNIIMHELQSFTSLRELTMAPIHINDLITSLLKRATHDGIKVDYTPVSHDLCVVGDAILLSQAFEHLLDNAWQATIARENSTSSRIRIQCDTDQGRAIISVQDHGVGMSDKVRRSMFDPFATTRGPQGRLGLGLTLVNQIVQAHAGEIYAQSVPGRGTSVSVVLRRTVECDRSLDIDPTLTLDAITESSTVENLTPHVVVVSTDKSASRELALMLVDSYEVDVFEDVQDALNFIATHPLIGFVLYDVDTLTDEWAHFYEQLDERYGAHVGLLMGGIPSFELREIINREQLPIFSRPLRGRTMLDMLSRLVLSSPSH
jgi:anti-sigma regulatory factor (Ser/Thr protein kinase)